MKARRMLFVMAALLAGTALADDLKSGPQVGCENDRRGFRPEFVTGPAAGKSLCPV
jgi:hypothetical protein